MKETEIKAETKKIYRSSDDYIVAGVSSGLADYFQIDTTLVRIIFILLTIGGGSGVLIYLVLWLIIPKKEGENMKKDREKNVKEFATDLKEKAQAVASEIRSETKSYRRRGSFLGLVLIILGGVLLVEKIAPMEIQWDYVWPGILVFLGLYLVFRKQ
jgi:phage shock protein C